MKLNKISIRNYKSIDTLEFQIRKYGDSYTTMFIGKNESGKSNILEAMAWLDIEEHEELDYDELHNQKDNDENPVQVDFYLSFERDDTYLKSVRSKIKNGDLLSFQIGEIKKSILIESGLQEPTIFYEYDLKILSKKIYIKENNDTYELSKDGEDDENYVLLDEEIFREYFGEKVIQSIKLNLPKSSFWKPSDEYLLTSVDLNTFKDDLNSNIPLKHIFALSGYDNREKVTNAISKISASHFRSKLISTLTDNLNKYINDIWRHSIKIHIEITDTGKCNINIQDDGKKNKHNFYPMSVRSEGFKQFMSLILSLSIETKKLGKRNSLILIDEPENHLHPSGIRDLREELLKIGENNYLFIATHSPFLVDTKQKERNIIIKKTPEAMTEKREIKDYEDTRDDEVLDEAFGINIYKDLLIPHRILVEGASDKIILSKAFSMLGDAYGITNGTGSNIITQASKLNHENIDVLVVVDDDSEGAGYKEEILKIGGIFTDDKVFTLRDLVGGAIAKSTIEDFLGIDFVNAMYKKFYKQNFSTETTEILDGTKPVIEQIKILLNREGKFSKENLDSFKKLLSDSFDPAKSTFKTKFPLLNELAEKIKEKLS